MANLEQIDKIKTEKVPKFENYEFFLQKHLISSKRKTFFGEKLLYDQLILRA